MVNPFFLVVNLPDDQDVPREKKRRNSERVNAKEFRRKEKHTDSGIKLVVFLLVGGILGGVVSYFAINLVFEGTMSSLEADKHSYEDEYSTISNEYRSLFEDYNTIVQDKKSLEAIVNSLHSEKASLQENLLELSQQLVLATGNNTELSLEVELLKEYLIDLNGVLYHLNASLNDYSVIPQAYSRVINSDTLDKIGDTVEVVTAGSSNPLEAYRDIYNYVTSTIDYVNDIEFPYIRGYSYVDVYDFDILQDITVSTIRNYVQTPDFTLEYGQGDCDDQAVLAYAMIGYYHRSQSTDTKFYLASLSFNDGSGHLTIFASSVQGLLIVDPSGLHFTTHSEQDAFRDTPLELSYYNTKWLANEGIAEIILHSVSVFDGSISLTYSGDLASVVGFLE